MSIEKLPNHYSYTSPFTVHDEESGTVLELLGRHGGKINEVVNDQNALRGETEDHLQKQDGRLTNMENVQIPENVTDEVQKRINDGSFNDSIDKYAGGLEARLDNLLGSTEGGSTTLDAEIIDMRVGVNGEVYENSGQSIRSQLDGLSSPTVFTPIPFKNYFYFKGGDHSQIKYTDKPFYNMHSKEVWDSLNDEGATSYYGMGAVLLNKIAYDENLTFSLFVKSKKPMKGVFYLTSGADLNGNLNTLANQGISINAGVNIINLDSLSFTKHVDFNNFKSTYFQPLDGGKNEDIECMYLFNGLDTSLLLELNNVYPFEFLTKESITLFKNNNSGNFTYENGRVTAIIDEKTTEEEEWRYSVLSMKIKKGKTYLVKGNSPQMQFFGVGDNTGSACRKAFGIGANELFLFKVDDFISDNQTLLDAGDNLYVNMCVSHPQVGITHTDAETYWFDIIEVKYTDKITPSGRLLTFEPSDYVKKTDIPDKEEYIVCWGDSLTALGGWTTILENLSGMPLLNAGTGGENVRTIVSRQGADTMIVNDITIPSEVEPVTVAKRENMGGIPTELGYISTPLFQGGHSHVNPVMIDGILGTLNWTGSSYDDETGLWTFTRKEVGEMKIINRPTAMTTYFDRDKNNPYLMVLFVGANGGYDSVEELVELHRLMKDHAKATHTIILGFTSGSEGRTEESMKNYETAMKKEFGRYFISLRDYLSKYGLADAGLTPTAEDKAYMDVGEVPHTLFTDGVHYTDACKTVIGNMLYKKCKELNIF